MLKSELFVLTTNAVIYSVQKIKERQLKKLPYISEFHLNHWHNADTRCQHPTPLHHPPEKKRINTQAHTKMMTKTTSILLLLSLVVTLLFISTTTTTASSPAYRRRHHSRRVYRRPTTNNIKRVFLSDDDRRRVERGRPTLHAIIDAITKDLEKLLAAQKSKLSKFALSQQVKPIKPIKPVLPQKTFLPTVAAAEEEILSDNTFDMRRRRRNGRNFGRKAQKEEQVKTTTTEVMAETQEGEKTNADGSLTLIKIGGVTGAVTVDDCSACKLMCRSPGTVKVGRCLSKCASSEVCKFQDNIAF